MLRTKASVVQKFSSLQDELTVATWWPQPITEEASLEPSPRPTRILRCSPPWSVYQNLLPSVVCKLQLGRSVERLLIPCNQSPNLAESSSPQTSTSINLLPMQQCVCLQSFAQSCSTLSMSNGPIAWCHSHRATSCHFSHGHTRGMPEARAVDGQP